MDNVGSNIVIDNTQIKINNNNLDANNNNNNLESFSSYDRFTDSCRFNKKSIKSNKNNCSYHSYFYSNQNTILNVFIMSYEEQLQKAITKGNLDLCKELVKLNCNLNLQVNRKLPLAIACEYNFYDIVEVLLKNGADPNQFDFFDQTALFYAVNSADFDIIKLLIHHGARINICDSNGTYPLHLSICRKNDEICDYLLSHGALIDATDKQNSTPLSLAITNDYSYMIYKLLDLGADPNISDNNGDTPLIKAIWSTMTTNCDNTEILTIIKKLVDLGADIDAKNESGRTALFTAVYQNSTDIALYLINKNAKCELEDLIMGNFSLLHYSCFQGNLALTKALLDKNCNVNATADFNETPVYVATTKGHLHIIDILIQYGAHVNEFAGDDADNRFTPLQAAIYYITEYELFKNIVDKLIQGHADLSIETPGPLLILCLQYNKYDFAKYLVSVGAHIEQRTIFNQSCFYKAFLSKNIEFMEMLILAGYNMYNDKWIGDYLENPDFIDYPNYYIKNSETLNSRTEDEISAFIDEEEYFNRRFRTRTNTTDLHANIELKKSIYNLLKHHYSNPLSLQDLVRISIRKHLLKTDYKIKSRVSSLLYPKRLKDYLLFMEFDI